MKLPSIVITMSSKYRHCPLRILKPDGPSVVLHLLRIIKLLVCSYPAHPTVVLMEVKMTPKNIQNMVRLTPGREQLAVLHHAQLCGVVVDLLAARGRALQQSVIEIFSNKMEYEMVADHEVPDTVIVSLLVVKHRVRKMFSRGNSIQHFHSGFGYKKEIT